jgi:hypothetical protein
LEYWNGGKMFRWAATAGHFTIEVQLRTHALLWPRRLLGLKGEGFMLQPMTCYGCSDLDIITHAIHLQWRFAQ